MDRVKLATVWLGGCSGCHMSFLDLDEWLLELAQVAELVYSPVVDTKEYPAGVDLVLVEGAVCNQDHLEMARCLRQRSKTVVSFGDCAVTGNVTAMRNPLCRAECVLRRAYLETAEVNPQIPAAAGIVPPLLDRVMPLQEVIAVDYFLPGCPPPAAHIKALLEQWLSGRPVQLSGPQIKFG
jgi:NAD-reducing hydrogenase small subunit